MKFYGMDVSKETLEIACDGSAMRVENSKQAIRSLVKTMSADARVAMEATNGAVFQVRTSWPERVSRVSMWPESPKSWAPERPGGQWAVVGGGGPTPFSTLDCVGHSGIKATVRLVRVPAGYI